MSYYRRYVQQTQLVLNTWDNEVLSNYTPANISCKELKEQIDASLQADDIVREIAIIINYSTSESTNALLGCLADHVIQENDLSLLALGYWVGPETGLDQQVLGRLADKCTALDTLQILGPNYMSQEASADLYAFAADVIEQ